MNYNLMLVSLILFYMFLIIAMLVISASIGKIKEEQDLRKQAEEELASTKKAFKTLCEDCIAENGSLHARIAYQAYFAGPVDLTGDGFIDMPE